VRVSAGATVRSNAAEEGFAAQSGGTPTIHVYSRETVVDVTVTDAKGKPVHGLTRANFTVTEDGKPQSIRGFQEFSKDTPVTASAPRNLPPNTYTNVDTGTGPLYVFLLDDINGGDTGQVRWAMAKFIKSMAPGTRVSLLALGDRLTVLQGPTTDTALLLKMVNAYVKPFTVTAVGCTRQVVFDWATLDQLKQVATYLSGIKDRKNVIWIGYGIPDMVWNGCQNWSGTLQQTYDLLEDAQVTVYPLNPTGVEAPPAPVYRGSPNTYAMQAVAQNSAWQRGLATDHLSLEAVAEATGGVAYYGRNLTDTTLIDEAFDAGANYYTLSYVPPSVEYDGRYHAISIKVDRPGVHLVYRKGYSAEDPTLIQHPPETFLGHITRDTRPTGSTADPLAAALSPIAPPATQLLFDVRVEPSTEPENPWDPPVMGALNPKLKQAPLTRYGFLFALPQSQIAFVDAGGDTYSGSVEFDVAVFDSDGKMVTSLSQTQKLPLTTEEYQQFIASPFQFFQQIDLPPGQFTMRVGVFDGVSNKLGTVEIPLTVGKKATASAIATGEKEHR
jgi:VWFA-related protein